MILFVIFFDASIPLNLAFMAYHKDLASTTIMRTEKMAISKRIFVQTLRECQDQLWIWFHLGDYVPIALLHGYEPIEDIYEDEKDVFCLKKEEIIVTDNSSSSSDDESSE
ncbi:hypothetical protein Tco_0601975 [Tanacetum coccineum]